MKAHISKVFLLVAVALTQNISNSNAALQYKRVSEGTTSAAAQGALAEVQREGSVYINPKEFCSVMGCRLTYQWDKQRILIFHKLSHSSAILSPLTSSFTCGGRMHKISKPVRRDSKNGYLFPLNVAEELASCLELGNIFYKAEEKTIVTEEEKSLVQPLSTIIIDSGHGGHDLGTGHGGIYEKDIVLFYAQKLKEDLQKEFPKLKIHLTRENDRYVSLGERARFANSRGAGLFISLHVNHADQVAIQGVETYVLSPEATDDESKKTALLENDSWTKNTEVKELPTSDGVKKLFIDLEQQHFIKNSALFAAYVQQEVSRVDSTVKNRGVKQAFFYVLSQAAMPAVLIEMGFLSNAEDKVRLMNAEFREKFVAALVVAVKRYHAQTLMKVKASL